LEIGNEQVDVRRR